MKKALALGLALSMIFALAACKSDEKKEDETTTAVEEIVEEAATNEDGETVEAPSEDAENEAEDAASDKADDKESSKETQKAEGNKGAASNSSSNKPAANNSKPAAQKGLNSTNPNEVAAFYVKARNATSPAPKGNQVMKLAGKIDGEGGVGKLVEFGQGIIDSALKNNSVPTDFIPAGGYADLRGADITSCSAKVQGNYTVVTVHLKDQTDGPNGNKTNGGAVSRGIGTLGSIDEALKELGGAQITEGRDKLTLTYTDAHFTVKIDNNSGKIVSGTWHYLVKINISEAKIKLGLSLPVKGLRAAVDYTVTI